MLAVIEFENGYSVCHKFFYARAAKTSICELSIPFNTKTQKTHITLKNPIKWRFEIEGSHDGSAATRAVSMFVVQVCSLERLLNRFRKSLMADGRDAEIA